LETIAVYWENKIKTYGFQIEYELSLFQLSITPHELASLGSALINEPGDIHFSWVLVQQPSRHVFSIYILLGQKWEQPMQALLERYRKNSGSLDLRTESPVEMIFFHGPHFGDRYGIADKALSTLREKGLPILAASCTGASVYIIVPEPRSAEVRDILSGVFDTPQK
jgi:aspartokinase